MDLNHHIRDGVDVVKLPERLTMTDSTAARASLIQIIKQGRGTLILDLSQTSLLDSSGLAVLMSSLQAARKKGGDVYLIGMGGAVRDLFELTRLNTIFQVFDDEAAALQRIGTG